MAAEPPPDEAPRAGDAVEPGVTLIAVAIVEHRDQFLVGVRGAELALAGKSEFPGGKQRPGESATAAAARECQEETGLAVVAREVLETVDHTYAHGALRLTFVRCELQDESASEPRGPFRWAPRDEVAQLDFPAANRRIVAQLCQRR